MQTSNSYNDDLTELLFRISDDGLGPTIEQYPHLFEKISDQLGFLAWTIAADMAELRGRLAEITTEAKP